MTKMPIFMNMVNTTKAGMFINNPYDQIDQYNQYAPHDPKEPYDQFDQYDPYVSI